MCISITVKHLSSEIETAKQNSSLLPSRLSLQAPSLCTIDKPSEEYGVMMKDVIRILESNHQSLKNMLIAFEHMAHSMKIKAFVDIVQSKEYVTLNSVRTFFRCLAPHMNPVDCSILRALVRAADCEKAKQRLDEYLCMSENSVLPKNDTKSCVHPEPETSSLHDLDSANDVTTTLTVAHTAVVRSQPVADSSEIPVMARIAEDEMTWGKLRRIQSLLCGLFTIPPFTLPYKEAESGSIVVKWVTSQDILPNAQALDGGDLMLLRQEKIVSIQIGMNYTIPVVSQDYCVSIHLCMCVRIMFFILSPIELCVYWLSRGRIVCTIDKVNNAIPECK